MLITECDGWYSIKEYEGRLTRLTCTEAVKLVEEKFGIKISLDDYNVTIHCIRMGNRWDSWASVEKVKPKEKK